MEESGDTRFFLLAFHSMFIFEHLESILTSLILFCFVSQLSDNSRLCRYKQLLNQDQNNHMSGIENIKEPAIPIIVTDFTALSVIH